MERRRTRRRWGQLALGLIALVAIALAVNALVTSAATKEARAGVGRVVELPGEDLQVLDVGPRHAPPIVLVHGYTGSIRWWDRVIPRLARRHRVVALDLLGHGGSDKPRDGYSIPHQARLVARALTARGVSGATVVGHSMGGSVAVALAADHPKAVERLLVLDMATRPSPGKASLNGSPTPRSSASSCATSRPTTPSGTATRTPSRRGSRSPTASSRTSER